MTDFSIVVKGNRTKLKRLQMNKERELIFEKAIQIKHVTISCFLLECVKKIMKINIKTMTSYDPLMLTYPVLR